ncbi:MAG: hypothetical protein ACR2J4_09095 [Deinococcus sp.]
MVKPRKGLGDLLRETAVQAERQPTEDLPTVTRPPAEEEVQQTTRDTNSVTLQLPDSRTSDIPKYARLTRKEARLREDQYEMLTRLARRLNRSKRRDASERITENTLIRIAVDYLIEHVNELGGSTEEELLRSINASE